MAIDSGETIVKEDKISSRIDGLATSLDSEWNQEETYPSQTYTSSLPTTKLI
jgi:hypothetical protein